jgi:hypothetical protein
VEDRNQHDDRNRVCNQYNTQTLNTICSRYKDISQSVLITQKVRLPGKRDDTNFAEFGFMKFSEHYIYKQ